MRRFSINTSSVFPHRWCLWHTVMSVYFLVSASDSYTFICSQLLFIVTFNFCTGILLFYFNNFCDVNNPCGICNLVDDDQWNKFEKEADVGMQEPPRALLLFWDL